MQVGDMNLVNAIVNLEVQVAFQGKILEKVLTGSTSLSVNEADTMRKAAQKMVADRYPQLDIKFN